MATGNALINENGQTRLEIDSISNRKDSLAREDYNNSNEYGASNPDAIATEGEILGKGTGGAGYHDWLPYYEKDKNSRNTIDYSNFTTDDTVGGCLDKTARRNAEARSIYNKNYEYGSNLIKTDINVANGQYKQTTIRNFKKKC